MACDFEHFAKTGKRRAVPPRKLPKGESSAFDRRQSKFTDAIVEQAVQRASNGDSITQIAKDIGSSKACVSDWVGGKRRVDVTGGSLYEKKAAELKTQIAEPPCAT